LSACGSLGRWAWLFFAWATCARAEGTRLAQAQPPVPPPEAVTPPAQPLTIPAEPLEQEELEALGLSPIAPVDTALHFSGFADFSFSAFTMPRDAALRTFPAGGGNTTFYIGNFNLYLTKNLTQSLRMLGEVRFMYLPNGATPFDGDQRINTTVADYNEFNRPTRWGGIEIERIHLDWIAHPRLIVRAGQFLTPYGIWNVDHGSPTVITVQRPSAINLDWFPERQTGFELFGRWERGLYHVLGYHFTLSNGTGPISEYADLDENKAVGARTYWEYHRLGELRVGVSGYYGKDTDARFVLVEEPGDDGVRARERIDSQFKELAGAFDVVWMHRGWHLQSEWIVYRQNLTDKGRAALQSRGVPPDSPLLRNATSWGGYVLGGYRFRWLGTMPFVMLEYVDAQRAVGEAAGGRGDVARTVNTHAGLNVRPVDVLVVKVVYTNVTALEGLLGDSFRVIQAQLAWAF
jgi:hypothetical protein